mgnify:CR=1 FL=1
MEESRQIDLELSEEATRLLEEYARKTGRTEEEVCEYILSEFLERQAGIIQKKAEETGRPVNELFNMQFTRLLEFLANKDKS